MQASSTRTTSTFHAPQLRPVAPAAGPAANPPRLHVRPNAPDDVGAAQVPAIAANVQLACTTADVGSSTSSTATPPPVAVAITSTPVSPPPARPASADLALLSAAEQGDATVVQSLLQSGAAVNQVDSEGWTALLCAARNGCTTIVQVLLQAGAKVDQAEKTGGTALMFAALEGHTVTVP